MLGLVNGELDRRGSFRYRDTHPDAVASGEVDVDGLVSFTEPLDRLAHALGRAAEPDTVKGTIPIDGSK